MAQKLKEDVRTSILEAAVDCFFDRGFLRTTLHDIAKKCGMAVGNLYRYYQNKEEIFYASFPKETIDNMRNTLKSKFSAGNGLPLNLSLETGSAAQNYIIDALAGQRKYWYAVFLKSEGTRYSNIKEEFISFISDLYIEYRKSTGAVPADDERFLSVQIYRALIDSFCAIMKENEDSGRIKTLCRRMLAYHFAGLEKLF